MGVGSYAIPGWMHLFRRHMGDAAAPMDEIEKVRAVFNGMDGAEITIYPGAKHGFMQPTNPPAYDEAVAAASWSRSLEILKAI